MSNSSRLMVIHPQIPIESTKKGAVEAIVERISHDVRMQRSPVLTKIKPRGDEGRFLQHLLKSLLLLGCNRDGAESNVQKTKEKTKIFTPL